MYIHELGVRPVTPSQAWAQLDAAQPADLRLHKVNFAIAPNTTNSRNIEQLTES
jgi:hypothetical protein